MCMCVCAGGGGGFEVRGAKGDRPITFTFLWNSYVFYALTWAGSTESCLNMASVQITS